MRYLTNAFSLNMLYGDNFTIGVNALSLDEAKCLGQDAVSVVGHADTAAIFESQLGYAVPPNRQTVSLAKGDELVVGQYIGPRLPEGVKTLPDGATIKWLRVVIS